MKIAVFGASGMIGSSIVQEAIERDHTVTAIARDPSSIEEAPPELVARKGNILNPDEVALLVSDHDAVISAFGPAGDQPPESLIEAAHSLIAGLDEAGVLRLVVVGGAGSLEVAPGVELMDTPDFPADWKAVATAHREALDVYRGCDLEWSYASPAAFIEPGVRTGQFRMDGDQLLVDEKGESRISTEDFAIAILDEVSEGRFIGERFSVAY